MLQRYAETDYLAQLQALAPTGAAWPREPEAVWTRLLAAAADELARVDARAANLAEEADPRTTLELLPDWERLAGLPDDCTLPAATVQERRAAVVEKLTRQGGQSIAYFTAVAAALGYTITIQEYRPFVAGLGRCGEHLNGDHTVRFNWRVTVAEPRAVYFRTGASLAGDRLLAIARAEDLECLLQRLRPAHTTLIFNYSGA